MGGDSLVGHERWPGQAQQIRIIGPVFQECQRPGMFACLGIARVQEDIGIDWSNSSFSHRTVNGIPVPQVDTGAHGPCPPIDGGLLSVTNFRGLPLFQGLRQ